MTTTNLSFRALAVGETKLEELPLEHHIKNDHVRIKVLYAALNHRDWWILKGLYPNCRFPSTLGSDACGIVVGVGQKVSSNWLNKEVIVNPSFDWGEDEKTNSTKMTILGSPHDGSFAQYMDVPADRLHLKPEHLTPKLAAAIPLAGVTAWRAVSVRGKVGAGQKVLVTRIGGGVAQFALLLSLSLGAEVWVTSGDQIKLEKAKGLGAKGGVNYKHGDWDKQLKSLVKGNFDAIIDSAGGDDLNKLISLVKMGGTMVSYGATAGRPKNFNVHALFLKQVRWFGTTMGSDKDFQEFMDFVSQKKNYTSGCVSSSSFTYSKCI
eukprot:TRINITY_DN2383_c0_g1_i2.p1 TRINITY_DN2383_c0_g1~~TRINITY_DN2383_c0_g1_i2.p1  ORF type:complete len:321 (+),score=83.53 TRINITY_DN2383_c0_g1_i2:98-1060(+)